MIDIKGATQLILNAFDRVYDNPNGNLNQILARELSIAFASIISSSTVISTDVGVVGGGTYSGVGTSTLEPSSSISEGIMLAAFNTMMTTMDLDATLFINCLANGIDTMVTGCKAVGGTTGAIATALFSTPAVGKATQASITIPCATTLTSTLLSVMHTLETMPNGGNEYLATAIATALITWMQTTTVTVIMSVPGGAVPGIGRFV